MAKSISIIVPTYKEGENLPLLMERIAAALTVTDLDWKVVIVDDNSPDQTVDVCKALAAKYPLQLIVRKHERGLASAVVAGMRAANSQYLVCIDADLSHPPEAIPEMIETLSSADCDFVIGSRYIAGGSTADDWGLFRWLNSVVATGLAKPLTSAKDPMAGFFALRKSDFESAEQKLDPVGYKIGLELIVKCDCCKVREVPIHFADRQFGESKLSLKEQLNYLRHLSKLYAYRWPDFSRFLQFGAVGFSGVFVNLAALNLFLQWHLVPPLAIALAIWVAMTWNFFFNRKFTFRDRASARVGKEYVLFCSASLTGAFLNWLVATWLWTAVPMFSKTPTLAGLVGIGVGMLFNFVLCRRFVFLERVHSMSIAGSTDDEPLKTRATAA